MDVWATVPVETGAYRYWQVGPLQLWLGRDRYEWFLATSREEDADRVVTETCDAAPEESEWRRWAADPQRESSARLQPVLPEKPLIVRPESVLGLLPGAEAVFFVGIPVWTRLSVGERETVVLVEQPTVDLSKSWFGTPAEGELCFALKTRARRALDDASPASYRAVCPVRIQNVSTSTLDFVRLCLRCGPLEVFRGSGRLWANELQVQFRGGELPSRVVPREGPPEQAGQAECVGPRREPLQKGVFAKTFDNLRTFTSL